MNPLHQLIATSFAFAVGASAGSFLNVCIWRLPRKESVTHPPSRCPSCKSGIAARDNIPILSWLQLRGRCRKCAWPIPLRYPVVEGVAGLLFALIMYVEVAKTDPFLEPPMLTLSRMGYQALFASLLVTSAMIEWDARRRQQRPSGVRRFDSTAAAVILSAWNGILIVALFLAGDFLGATLSFGLLLILLGRFERIRRPMIAGAGSAVSTFDRS